MCKVMGKVIPLLSSIDSLSLRENRNLEMTPEGFLERDVNLYYGIVSKITTSSIAYRLNLPREANKLFDVSNTDNEVLRDIFYAFKDMHKRRARAV